MTQHRRWYRSLCATGAVLLAGAGLVAVAVPAGAAVSSCQVNQLTDEGGAHNGTCDSTLGAGKVTLRSAIEEFNIDGGTFNITFDPSLPNPSTVSLNNVALLVAGNDSGGSLTITGAGMAATKVDAHHQSKLITVPATNNPTLTLKNLTLENGEALAAAGIQDLANTLLTLDGVELIGNIVPTGGGNVSGTSIAASGDLSMTNSVDTLNQGTGDTTGNANGAFTGEIVAKNATITNSSVTHNFGTSALNGSNDGLIDATDTTITNSHFDHNTFNASGSGGFYGIFDTNITTLTDVSADGNSVTVSGNGTFDGLLDTTTTTIDRASFSSNTVSVGDNGAAIGLLFPGRGQTPNRFTNMTVANNSLSVGQSSTVDGFLFNGDGAHNIIVNSTFARNALTTGVGATITGGTLYPGPNGESTPVMEVINVILAKNTPTDCNGTHLPASTSHSMDSDASCGLSGNGNQSNVDPNLAAETINAPGSTQTMAIDASSAAYNKADNAACPTVDQRGVTRIFPGDPTCDVGAYEFVPAPAASPSPTPSPTPKVLLPPAGGEAGGGQTPAPLLGLGIAAALGVLGLARAARRRA